MGRPAVIHCPENQGDYYAQVAVQESGSVGSGILEVLADIALIAALAYFSTLVCALRDRSRTRIGDYLSEARRRVWFARLELHEHELQLVAGIVRAGLLLLLLATLFDSVPGSESDPRGWLERWFAPLAAASAILLVFAIALPHALARHTGSAIVARSLGLLWALRWILFPLVYMSLGFDALVRRLLGRPEVTEELAAERHEQEILEAVSAGELSGALDEEQKEIIESVFALPDTPVSAVMKPRTEIVALDVKSDFEQVRQTIIQAGHSRIPVYEGTLDHIIGVLYAKDLFRVASQAQFDLRSSIRTVPYVPEAKPIDALLRELRQRRVHMAIVLDEYGGTAGLVTIEDILEELVGEIADEFDTGSRESIQRVDADTLEVDARVPVREVNVELEIALPEDGPYDTIGGFVFATLGKIPIRDEELRHENVRVRVLEADARRIQRLRIHVERARVGAL